MNKKILLLLLTIGFYNSCKSDVQEVEEIHNTEAKQHPSYSNKTDTKVEPTEQKVDISEEIQETLQEKGIEVNDNSLDSDKAEEVRTKLEKAAKASENKALGHEETYLKYERFLKNIDLESGEDIKELSRWSEDFYHKKYYTEVPAYAHKVDSLERALGLD